jgi:hypothetical protein
LPERENKDEKGNEERRKNREKYGNGEGKKKRSHQNWIVWRPELRQNDVGRGVQLDWGQRTEIMEDKRRDRERYAI